MPRSFALLATLIGSLALAAQDPTPRPKPQPKPAAQATVGNAAPKFRLNDDGGSITSVGGTSKTWTVLAFYPKAATGG